MAAGRAFKPTEDQRRLVQVMRANGVPVNIIAKNIVAGGIDYKTLVKHFATELEDGLEQIRAELGRVVVRSGLNGDWRAAIAWLQRFGGQTWKLTAADFDAYAVANGQAATVIKIIGGLPSPPTAEQAPALPDETANSSNGSSEPQH
jgi:hypothetical protein